MVDLSLAVLRNGEESERNRPETSKSTRNEMISFKLRVRSRHERVETREREGATRDSPDRLVLLGLHVSSREESVLPDLNLPSGDLLDGEHRETDLERPGVHDLGDVLSGRLADSVPQITSISVAEGLLLEVDRNSLDEDVLSDLQERGEHETTSAESAKETTRRESRKGTTNDG